MHRRTLLKFMGYGGASLLATPLMSCASKKIAVPNYLSGFEGTYTTDPKQANMDWFTAAKFGMFIHYGLYSLLGRGEWVQIKEKIPVLEYEKLKDRFTAENFDADFITDLALMAGMKYINITTRHHDSFCLFNTKTTSFNSVNSPAKRDLVEELATACDKKGLGLCLYFSHGRDWRHPHAANNDKWGGHARPTYNPKENYYKYGSEHDLDIYIEYMHEQLTELLTNYGTIANIWLDGHAVPKSGDTAQFRMQDTYDLIHNLQPQTLISYKTGYLGTEDFYAPEIHWLEQRPDVQKQMLNAKKPIEICSHIAGWGYTKKFDGKHPGAEAIFKKLKTAKTYNNSNLLLNLAPRGDGSFDPQDIASLTEVGEHIRKFGI
ncbi:alpha-L-fucosidase [Paraglaciecola sp. L3A3]|uniref:alpha-L-fucosidase n=1 Tax=Paraglaciecola sp. L3A3 TaxID=2686358 RepID=UPI00131C83DB|nr:alpha-L-fucosidase [Paraglaciecola sp. L3A3]